MRSRSFQDSRVFATIQHHCKAGDINLNACNDRLTKAACCCREVKFDALGFSDRPDYATSLLCTENWAQISLPLSTSLHTSADAFARTCGSVATERGYSRLREGVRLVLCVGDRILRSLSYFGTLSNVYNGNKLCHQPSYPSPYLTSPPILPIPRPTQVVSSSSSLSRREVSSRLRTAWRVWMGPPFCLQVLFAGTKAATPVASRLHRTTAKLF